nr:MAG TPA: hypothetical protein [Caudoviricetes sp.]
MYRRVSIYIYYIHVWTSFLSEIWQECVLLT